MGKSGESSWQARGGHRLWIAPEDPVLSYALDNSSIRAEVRPDGIALIGSTEKETGLEKQIVVKLSSSGSAVEVIHKITNKSPKAREFAPWSLTMMAPGGMEMMALPPR